MSSRGKFYWSVRHGWVSFTKFVRVPPIIREKSQVKEEKPKAQCSGKAHLGCKGHKSFCILCAAPQSNRCTSGFRRPSRVRQMSKLGKSRPEASSYSLEVKIRISMYLAFFHVGLLAELTCLNGISERKENVGWIVVGFIKGMETYPIMVPIGSFASQMLLSSLL